MTAINGVVQGKRVYLYGDTAWLNCRDGTVAGFGTKIFAGSRFPWAIGLTWTAGVPTDAVYGVQEIAHVPNVAGLIAGIPGVLQAYLRRSQASGVENAGMRVLVGCWDSRKQKARLFFASSMLDGTEAFGPTGEVTEVRSFFASPRTAEDLLGRSVDPSDPSSFDPDADGLAMMQAQRADRIVPAISGAITGAKDVCGVGGECEQVIITRRGVKCFSLHTWPDQLGELIDPTRDAAEALPALQAA